ARHPPEQGAARQPAELRRAQPGGRRHRRRRRADRERDCTAAAAAAGELAGTRACPPPHLTLPLRGSLPLGPGGAGEGRGEAGWGEETNAIETNADRAR